MNDKSVIGAVRGWLEAVVIELNLCPFARAELVKNNIIFVVSAAITEVQLLQDLEAELLALKQNDESLTTLLIVPAMLQSFFSFNQFLDVAEGFLIEMELDGVFQIASFHPDYQFSGTQPEDVENYTNKSPYPILHLLSEAQMARSLALYANAEEIPERNIKLLESLGKNKIEEIFRKI